MVLLERLSLKQALDKVEKFIQFVTTAKIMYINHIDMTYISCGHCSAGIANGSCKTHGTNFGQYRLRYNLAIHLEQGDDRIVATGFDNVGTILFGMDVSALLKLKDVDLNAFNKVFTDVVQKNYELQLSYKLVRNEEIENNEVKCTIISIDK